MVAREGTNFEQEEGIHHYDSVKAAIRQAIGAVASSTTITAAAAVVQLQIHTYKRYRAWSQDLKQFPTTNNCTGGLRHAQDSKVLSPGHLKCRAMAVKMAPTGAHTSLFLMVCDVERNQGQTLSCHICLGVATTKETECKKCGAQCHKKCSSLTGNNNNSYF